MPTDRRMRQQHAPAPTTNNCHLKDSSKLYKLKIVIPTAGLTRTAVADKDVYTSATPRKHLFCTKGWQNPFVARVKLASGTSSWRLAVKKATDITGFCSSMTPLPAHAAGIFQVTMCMHFCEPYVTWRSHYAI